MIGRHIRLLSRRHTGDAGEEGKKDQVKTSIASSKDDEGRKGSFH